MKRQILISEMQRLQDDLLSMGSMVEFALRDAVDVLQTRDFERGNGLISADSHINALYYDIEQGCVRLIATQNPRAGDLRLLTSIISISAELERIGDYAKGIAKVNNLVGEEELMKPLIDIPAMSAKARGMLHRSLVAFTRRDLALAREIPTEDDEVDQLYQQVYRELFTYMLQNPHHINQGNYLLWAAHNLERAADRVTNICQRVIYMVTGQIINLEDDSGAFAFNSIEPVRTLNGVR